MSDEETNKQHLSNLADEWGKVIVSNDVHAIGRAIFFSKSTVRGNAFCRTSHLLKKTKLT